MLTLKEVASKVMNAIGWKVNQFTFPTRKGQAVNEAEECFYCDDAENNRRLWFHLTESAIPQGTTLRLSEVDANAWQALALKHIKSKVKRVKESGSARPRREERELI